MSDPLSPAPVRPEGYYWVRWHGALCIACWMNAGKNDWTWVNEAGPDYSALDPEKEVQVIFGPLHLHCYSRDCLRGSAAMGRSTAENYPASFKPDGCECPCAACCAAIEARVGGDPKP